MSQRTPPDYDPSRSFPPRYEIFPPRLNSPPVVSPTDPYLNAPNPHTTRQPWGYPHRVAVYGEPRPEVRDPSPADFGPAERNDFRPPIIIPGERWKSGDK